jgi:methionyl-tRNA formyltransferase
VEQDPSLVTWAPEPEGAALRSDFGWSTERVLRRVRALSPVPGVALEIAGLEFFVTRARETQGFPKALHPGEAGVVDSTLVIRTGDGAIAVERAVLADNPGLDCGSELEERSLGRLVAQRLALRDSQPSER